MANTDRFGVNWCFFLTPDEKGSVKQKKPKLCQPSGPRRLKAKVFSIASIMWHVCGPPGELLVKKTSLDDARCFEMANQWNEIWVNIIGVLFFISLSPITHVSPDFDWVNLCKFVEG